MTVNELKKEILKASFEAKACHIGSALGCVILVKHLFKIAKPEDVVMFGKASGVAALYVVLADRGFFPMEKVTEYLKQYPLPSKEVPGVIHSFGSVGHALPIAVGLAYANKKRRVYCLISDGDLMEGTAYESALFARQHKLTNLQVWVDDNRLVACGKTSDILDLETAYEFFDKTFPIFNQVKTTKGEGVDFMTNRFEWHYENLTQEQLDNALAQL